MATRRVYRGIEEAALLGTFKDKDIYPHSFLARRLRWLYRETCDFNNLMYVRAQVRASVYGNSGLDPTKGYREIQDHLNADNIFPYLKRSRSRFKVSNENMLKLLKRLKTKISSEQIINFHKNIDKAREARKAKEELENNGNPDNTERINCNKTSCKV